VTPDAPVSSPLSRRREFNQVVAAAYFPSLGVPVIEGRNVELSDTSGHEAAVVIPSDFAKDLWGSIDLVGRRLRSVD
jgi:hypothetical protein